MDSNKLLYEVVAKLLALVGEIEAMIEAEEKAYDDEMEEFRRAMSDAERDGLRNEDEWEENIPF